MRSDRSDRRKNEDEFLALRGMWGAIPCYKGLAGHRGAGGVTAEQVTVPGCVGVRTKEVASWGCSVLFKNNLSVYLW